MTKVSFPLVAIIVLTWNQRDLTLDCLASLIELNYPVDQFQIIVVDNGSSDDTAAAVRERYPYVIVLENSDNLGYAGGNNVGIRHALRSQVEYICILNNDVNVQPGFLAPLLEVLAKSPPVGVATPLVAELDRPTRVWCLGATIDHRTAAATRLHAGAWVADAVPLPPFDVDVAAGAAMLVKRAVFEQAGFMDEDFFLYYEETDWCLRLRRYGFRILAVPKSVVYHKVSATLGQRSPIIDYYMTRNQFHFIRRHWSGPHQQWLWWRTIGRHLLAIGAYTIKPEGGQRIPNRNARLFALRDAIRGRWGKMGLDVAAICYPGSK